MSSRTVNPRAVNPRTAAAVIAGKAARRAMRASGSGGTALPGLLAQRIDPAAAPNLARNLRRVVLVTGTNGKTTTSSMLARILRQHRRQVLHNHSGSNLLRGVLASLIDSAAPHGALPPGRTAVFETDEAALPAIARAVISPHAPEPPILLFTNLMRDQLDRYGEIEAVAQRWRAALETLPPETSVIINADDPLLDPLARSAPGPVLRFGIDDAPSDAPDAEPLDAVWDPDSGQDFRYDRRFFAHLGHWRTDAGAARSAPAISASAISEHPDRINFTLNLGQSPQPVELPAQGLYSVCNALAAAAAAHALAIPPATIARSLQRHQPVFGRQERIQAGDRSIRILLGKNPAGMNQALRTLQLPADRHHLLVLLNDGAADGEDVSWIWDTDWESQAPHVESLAIGGRRAADLALRLEYAGFPPPALPIHRDPADALRSALRSIPPRAELVVLPTYTALLAIRSLLAADASAPAWWQAHGAPA